VNLEQLEAISAVVEHGGFRAAAEFLNKSQPALSQSVRNLEEEFGIKIFDRESYRAKLTEVGAVFLASSREALEASRRTARIAQELGQKDVELKIRVAVDALAPIQSIELMALECSRPVVPVTLILEKTILQGSHTQLIDGTVDLALAPSPADDRKIESLPVETVSLVGVVSRKLLQEKRVANAEFLRTHPQVLVYDKTFDEPADALNPSPISGDGGPKIFTPDHFTKLALIAAGVGWGRLSKSELDSTEGLVPMDSKLCKPIKLELCLMRAKHRPIGIIARKIWGVFEARQLSTRASKR
jgi:DNA-binding transcriptional LysR family regulator